MTPTPLMFTAASSEPVASFTMSLHAGWRTPEGKPGSRPTAGNVVILCVVKPELPVMISGSWVQATDRVFYKMVGPAEDDPVFWVRVPAADDEDEDATPVEWEIHGYEVSGAELRPLDEGSGVPWTTTPMEIGFGKD